MVQKVRDLIGLVGLFFEMAPRYLRWWADRLEKWWVERSVPPISRSAPLPRPRRQER